MFFSLIALTKVSENFILYNLFLLIILTNSFNMHHFWSLKRPFKDYISVTLSASLLLYFELILLYPLLMHRSWEKLV